METTTRVLNAAEKRMRKGGYNSVSFRDLADDTGIKSSSVHYHFPKKEDLGSALVARYAERFFTTLSDATTKAKTPHDRLKAYTQLFKSALVDDRAMCLCGLLGAENDGLPEAVSKEVQKFFNASIEWLENALPESLSKTIRKNTACTLLASHQGALMLATSMKDEKIFDSITDTAVRLASSET